MSEEQGPVVVVFPRLSRWARRLCIWYGVAWLVATLSVAFAGRLGFSLPQWLALRPASVFARYELWRVVTYVLFELDPMSAVWAALMFWWFASPVEQKLGARKLFALLGAATLGGASAVLLAGRLSPVHAALAAYGAGPLDGALLAAWGFTHAGEPVSFLGLVRTTGARLALVFAGLLVVSSLYAFSNDGFARIGGLLAGAATMLYWQRSTASKPSRPARAPARRDPARRFEVLQGGRADDDPRRWN